MQGTDEEELERVMEVSGMRDTDVWAPLTAAGGDHLYDSEEEEMGGGSVFDLGAREVKGGGILRPYAGGVGLTGRVAGS